MPATAYRIETRRLVIRCWNPADAPLLAEAVEANLPHLKPWMPWAHQVDTLEDRIQRIRRMRADFDLDKEYFYGIFSADESRVLGGAGLHPRSGAGSRDIGYWIHVEETRKGLATEVAAALTRVGFEIHELERIEIHCDPANVASAGVPRKLGFTHEATLRQRERHPDGTSRDSMIWTMLRSEYESGKLPPVEIKAFDAMGRSLL